MAKSSKSAATDILVVNGPNLNLLGQREPEIYGRETLADIGQAVLARAAELGLNLDFRQSNHEADLITWIQQARDGARAIIINPAGLGHTSVALLDALTLAELPVIEVHLSNIFRRESFRHHSYVSLVAKGIICGLGAQGYLLAVDAAAAILTGGKPKSSPKRSKQGRS